MKNDTVLNELMRIMEASFDPYWREAWTRKQVADALVLPNTHAMLFDETGEPLSKPGHAVGFVLSRHICGEEELLLIAVHPAQRGRGLGKRILETFVSRAIERGADSIFLEMRANNCAGSLYERCGFVAVGLRRDYYRTVTGEPIDAITFARKTNDR